MLFLIDFEIENYHYFLDKVSDIDDLIRGLSMISPFANDALDVAEGMTENDFIDFKLALSQERLASQGLAESRMPKKFLPIVLPDEFMTPLMMDYKKFGVSFSIMLSRYMEVKTSTAVGDILLE